MCIPPGLLGFVRKKITHCALSILCFLVIASVAPWQQSRAAQTSPTLESPALVDMYLYLEDISDLNLTLGTFDITAQLLLRWQDERVSFDPADNNGIDRKVWVGKQAAKRLETMWQPLLEVSGVKGLSARDVHSLIVYADGSVELHEKLHATPQFVGELESYPFGRLNLNFVLTSVAMDTAQINYSLKYLDPTDMETLDAIVHGNWEPVSIAWHLNAVPRPDVPDELFPQAEVKIVVEHDFIDGLHKIFLPLFIIGMAACGLQWINHLAQPAYSSGRVGGLTTLILTTIALKFVLTRELPVLHYGTLTDALFNVTIVMLIIGLLFSCAISALLTEGHQHKAVMVNQIVRKVYPFVYLIAVILMFIIF